jgi:glycosyltransferase involved in cell wall biosynthesis
VPSVVIEGIAPEIVDNVDLVPEANLPFFLYSGTLSAAYGIEKLLASFAGANLEAELWICGRGPLEPIVKSYSAGDPRIRFLGFLSQQELNAVQCKAKALLITRDPEERFARYSFPSKLIEYLATGVPVISTRLPGIPDFYFEYVTVIEPLSENSIVECLRMHLLKSSATIRENGKQAQFFLKSQRNARIAVLPLLGLMGIIRE